MLRWIVPFFDVELSLLAALMIAALPAIGCQSALFTAMYLFKGTDVDPDFKELKGKKVAVVCRPMASLQYSNSNVGRDLAQQITLLLQEQVPKIKTIDQRKIAKWTDENTWEEYPEVGKAMKADMVVAVDLESFSIYQGQTLYQGKANATIRVFDCTKKGKGKEVFHKSIPQCRLSAERSDARLRADRAGIPPRVRARAGQPDRPAFLRPRPACRPGPRRRRPEIAFCRSFRGLDATLTGRPSAHLPLRASSSAGRTPLLRNGAGRVVPRREGSALRDGRRPTSSPIDQPALGKDKHHAIQTTLLADDASWRLAAGPLAVAAIVSVAAFQSPAFGQAEEARRQKRQGRADDSPSPKKTRTSHRRRPATGADVLPRRGSRRIRTRKRQEGHPDRVVARLEAEPERLQGSCQGLQKTRLRGDRAGPARARREHATGKAHSRDDTLDAAKMAPAQFGLMVTQDMKAVKDFSGKRTTPAS